METAGDTLLLVVIAIVGAWVLFEGILLMAERWHAWRAKTDYKTHLDKSVKAFCRSCNSVVYFKLRDLHEGNCPSISECGNGMLSCKGQGSQDEEGLHRRSERHT